MAFLCGCNGGLCSVRSTRFLGVNKDLTMASGFHAFDRILGCSLDVWSDLVWLRGSALVGDHTCGKKALNVHVACDRRNPRTHGQRQTTMSTRPSLCHLYEDFGEMILISKLITCPTTRRHDIKSNLASIPNFRILEQRSHGSEANLPPCHEVTTKTRYVQTNVCEQRAPRG